MSTKHKYVRHSTLGFILWPYSDDLYHRHIGDAIRRCDAPGEILSAGFAYIGPLTVVCNGESESLGMKSRPDDSIELARQLGRSTTGDKVHASPPPRIFIGQVGDH